MMMKLQRMNSLIFVLWVLVILNEVACFQRTRNLLHRSAQHAQHSSHNSAIPMNIVIEDTNLWRKGYVNCDEEVCELLNGPVPSDLTGTYYRNIHGKYKIGSKEIMHPFDADGMITALSFQNNSVFFRNRFVRTEGYLKERRAKKILFRGAFGTSLSGGMLSNMFNTQLKNVANTNVIYFAKRLLALWESGVPYQLEPDTLTTVGKDHLKGILRKDEPFTAHPKLDPESGHLIGFNYLPSPSQTRLRIMEMNDNLNVIQEKLLHIPGFALFHDMAVTPNYYLFVQAPFEFDPLPFVFGIKSPAACMKFKSNSKAKLHIIPRRSNSIYKQRVVDIDTYFNFHVANAFEDLDTGNIVIDVVGSRKMFIMDSKKRDLPIWKTFDWSEFTAATLQRYTVFEQPRNIQNKLVSFEKRTLFDHQFEMPCIAPHVLGKNATFIYGITTRQTYFAAKQTPQTHQEVAVEEDLIPQVGPFQSLVKIDTVAGTIRKYDLEATEFIGEPVFAPKRPPISSSSVEVRDVMEDDGYILVMTLKPAEKLSFLLIFDAKDIQQGPIQRIQLPIFVSYGLHGNFVPNLTFDFEEVQKKFATFTKIDRNYQ